MAPPIAGENGNWACPQCRNVNFAMREACNRCQMPKPSQELIGLANLGALTGLTGGGGGGGKGPPVVGYNGNWLCPLCSNVNYGTREACNRCQTPRPPQVVGQQLAGATAFTPGAGMVAGQPNLGVGGRGGAPIAGINGNWACPLCQNVNFPTREACNRCQTPKPPQESSTEEDILAQLMQSVQQQPQQQFGGGRSSRGAAPMAGINGNWACPLCQNVNFPSREVCNRCQGPKPQPQETVNATFDQELINQLVLQQQQIAAAGSVSGVGGGTKRAAPVAGVDGNWACPLCQNVNFPTREACNRCQSPKPQEAQLNASAANVAEQELLNQLLLQQQQQQQHQHQQQQQSAGTAVSSPLVPGADGNWSCPLCGNTNFGVLSTCNLCQTPKPQEDTQAFAAAAQVLASIGKARSGGPPVAGVDGAWSCPLCDNVNFAEREACNRCQTPKPQVAQDHFQQQPQQPQQQALGAGMKGMAPIAGVNGNWACPMCQNVNFPTREACNRCQMPKPQEAAQQQQQQQEIQQRQFDLGASEQDFLTQLLQQQIGGVKGRSTAAPIAGVDGNWACAICRNVNFPGREACNRCQTPKSQAEGYISSPGGKGRAPIAGVDGNWACPYCMNINFGMREVCNRCQAAKPQDSQGDGAQTQVLQEAYEHQSFDQQSFDQQSYEQQSYEQQYEYDEIIDPEAKRLKLT